MVVTVKVLRLLHEPELKIPYQWSFLMGQPLENMKQFGIVLYQWKFFMGKP